MTAKPLILIAALLTAPAIGQIMYKCPDPAGVVKFQQAPCPNRQSVTVNTAPTGADGLRDSERLYLEERQKQSTQPTVTTSASEKPSECFSMRRRILELEKREARGIHTRVSNEEESAYRKREYEALCGPW